MYRSGAAESDSALTDGAFNAEGFSQPTLDSLGTPLSEVTFCVVDLETTGLAADACGITEIGAVKVRGGEVIGEFGTLVNPGESIDPRVTRLTGITDEMVADAPGIEAVLPAFLEFARGATLVAHNAGFDIGFLRHACELTDTRWPRPPVVDTVVLARRLTEKSEVPNRRLGTLARLFGSPVTPNHRALDDARATVTVLHGLIERASGHGVVTDAELVEFCRAIPSELQRRKKHLADGLPHAPGVYIFRDADDRALYIGVSVDVAARVRSYFSAAEQRRRLRDMLASAERVEVVECAHRLEAGVAELRLISGGKPPYNRAAKFPEHRSWVRLTDEPYPRLQISRNPPGPGTPRLGPTSGTQAQAAIGAIEAALPIRSCRTRLSPKRLSPSCVLGEIGKCVEPCRHSVSVEEYAAVAERAARAMDGDPAPIAAAVAERLAELSAAERFETAAERRDELGAYLQLAAATHRTRSLVAAGEIVAAGRAKGGGWEIAVIRHGLLAGAARTPPRADPMPHIARLRETSRVVEALDDVADAAHAAESRLLLEWLARPDVRLVMVERAWASRLDGAERWDGAIPHDPSPWRRSNGERLPHGGT
ncbi:DEDD exonuclease domain-containing protein [Glycomyces luteolus]|uniref:DEDD exonuclease domain-containing protein n=1 Tax=Glycomyces luteolus TaxID=2670330 RepID=A0A9X3PHV8_9ACTN|nr:DEDD exonuclease domain-containing protein [Glycomyces luteolus]MDA1358775.1 DEDD exonuclease domain-containing protein [Glycomyces luteolus]